MINNFDEKLGYRFARANAAMLSRLNRQLRAYGLRHTDATVLVLIGDNPGISQSALCPTLAIASANMVPLIGRLVKQGLLTRSKANGRTYGLTLTCEGTALANAVQIEMTSHEDWLRAALLPKEHELIWTILAKFEAAT